MNIKFEFIILFSKYIYSLGYYDDNEAAGQYLNYINKSMNLKFFKVFFILYFNLVPEFAKNSGEIPCFLITIKFFCCSEI